MKPVLKIRFWKVVFTSSPIYRSFTHKLAAKYINGSVQLEEALLEQAVVALLPGTEFGRPGSKIDPQAFLCKL